MGNEDVDGRKALKNDYLTVANAAYTYHASFWRTNVHNGMYRPTG